MPETEEQQATVLKAWDDWYGALGESIVDGGAPFSPMAKSVNADGAVNDGPVGTAASGYTIVKADSLDVATEMAKGCPVLTDGGSVSVYETFNATEEM